MKNTANDELLVELQLQSNTYNHNKVTKTFKPKRVESSVSQKMVDEYKRDLLRQDLERKTDPAVRAIIAGKPTLTDLTPLEAQYVAEVNDFNVANKIYIDAVNDLTIDKIKLQDFINRKSELDQYLGNTKIINSAEARKKDLNADIKKITGKKTKEEKEQIRKWNAEIKEMENIIADYKSDEKKLIGEKNYLTVTGIPDIKKDIKLKEIVIPNNQKDKDMAELKYKATETKIQASKLLNLQSVTNYKQSVANATLAQLPDQTPGEPDADYSQRIQDAVTSNITDADIQSMMEYDQIKLLKTNFSAVFNLDRSKTLSIVESVIRQLPPSQIYELNTKWDGFKKVYSEIYGINNDNITVKILFDLIVGYLAGPTGVSTTKLGPLPVKPGPPAVTPTNPLPLGPSGAPQYTTIEASISPIVVNPTPNTTAPTNAYQDPDATDFIDDVKNGRYYVTKFLFNTKHYLGLSGSGDIGDYKIVQPWFNTLDSKGSVIVPRSLWSANNFGGGDTIVYNHFISKYFDVNGEKKAKQQYKYQVINASTAIVGTAKYKYKQSNKTSNTKQLIGAGISIPKHDKIVHFGNVLLMYDRLLRHNMLSIKKKGGGNIENFKNVKVSDKFVDIITGALNKQNIRDIYHELSEKEQELYNILVQVSNVHKYVNIPKPNIKFLKDRLKIVEGEIEAGNDNLIGELTDILHTMMVVKLITKKEATEHLQYYMDMNQ